MVRFTSSIGLLVSLFALYLLITQPVEAEPGKLDEVRTVPAVELERYGVLGAAEMLRYLGPLQALAK